jgi:subtilisin family serine protease
MQNFKWSLLLLAPTFILNANAKTAVIPKVELREYKKLESLAHTYVVQKNAKGTILESLSFLKATPENWFNLDAATDNVQGVSSERVYTEFGMPNAEDIIVAVIDSGVDVNHEDLQGKIWINTKEIPGNGIDDDGNGYVDDVFGWNFIGGPEGNAEVVADNSINGLKLIQGDMQYQVSGDTLEVTRELVRLTLLKKELAEIGLSLSKSEEKLLTEVSGIVKEKFANAEEGFLTWNGHLSEFQESKHILLKDGLTEFTYEAVSKHMTKDPRAAAAQKTILNFLSQDFDETRLMDYVGYFEAGYKYHYNVKFDSRKIVKDNYKNQTEKFYGNNNVIGPDAGHGTHVAGIIAADRNNNLGVKGVAENVKIMAIRVVPDGDERDKDVANGIRYAVDNGAKIINMSFGKDYSPYKKVVDEAVKYAESKGVILIHAAGNSNQNNDTEPNFPNKYLKNERRMAKNYLSIGASSYKKGASLAANFSNYGKKSVDIFAPGVDILSTTPDNNYDTYSGTSMAAPAAAGVLALMLSYDETMDMNKVKSVLMQTSMRYPTLKVNKAGGIFFSELSVNGGITNAYQAVQAILGM